MSISELRSVMKHYADRGLRDWKRADGNLKTRARECLANQIAETPFHLSQTLNTEFKGDNAHKLHFIPMPRRPPKTSGFELGFFLPIQKTNGVDGEVSFDLFLLVEDRHCLAFRFEPAHPAKEAHDYWHVQLSRNLLLGTRETLVPSWVPDSYPAIPIRRSHPLGMFLTMLTAVHGNSGGLVEMLPEMLKANQRYLLRCRDVLSEVLG
jgi:hypothetical protein